ncbi:MAG: signal peptidase I [Chloroflexota bacterium]
MPTPPQPQPAAEKRGHAIREIAVTVILAVVLFWVIQTFVAQTFRVEGQSMDTTLADGQHLLIDKISPRFLPYSRGDIVVLHAPESEHTDTPFIKRVIGVAGDHVEIKGGKVYVNGEALDEPYVHAGATTSPTGGGTEWDIDAGHVLVMGDNRPHSEDGRAFGEIPTDAIVGRALIRFWPIDTLHLF